MTEPLPPVIGGRYKVVREIGRGRTGAVYEAEHQTGGERVAIKVMTSGANDAEVLERLRREARTSRQIQSEHVAKIADVDVAPELGGRPFVVMELLLGADLRRLVANEGRLPPAEVLGYLQQAARGLERAHAAGLVHGDLKPESLFVHTTSEGRRIVKVLDFGMPRSDASAVDARTDICALGVIAVELLTGSSATMQGAALTPPRERWPFLPQGIDPWFMRSCAKDPSERWGSVKEQIDALEAILVPRSPAEVPLLQGASAVAVEEEQPAPYLLYAGAIVVVVASAAISTALLLGRGGPLSGGGAAAPGAETRVAAAVDAGWVAAPDAGTPVATAMAHVPPSGADDAGSAVASAVASASAKPAASVEAEADVAVKAASSAKPVPSADADGPGFLSIFTSPRAKVIERGRVLCTGTPCVKLALSPGPHTITLENKEESLKTVVVVNISSGETTTKRVAFKR